jgi:hypothetical protein
MIQFKTIADDDPVLAHSPIVKGATKVLEYVAEDGPIGLTESKGFKRHFVHWAAREFAWPGMTEEVLFAVNKVLNEYDFPPLAVLHDLLVHLKIGRHYRKAFRVSKAGQKLVGRPGKLFGILTPFYLFEVNHSYYSRFDDELLGNWDIFLNILNVEAEDAVSADEIARILYGPKSNDEGPHRLVSSTLYSHLLRPLCWTGLLSEHSSGQGSLSNRIYIKT